MEVDDVKMGLLDYIASKVGCMYLSDLHEPQNLLSIQSTLHSIVPSMFGLEEWSEMVAYITGEYIYFQSGEQAMEYLLSYKHNEKSPRREML